MRINLGCGRKQLKGWVNIDHNDFGQELKLDLENEPLPFGDNEADIIRADHFIEHLKDTKHLLNECWRVLKPEGTFVIYVPYGLWDRQFSPVHFQIITEHWFNWLGKDDNEEYYGLKRWKDIKITAAEKNGAKHELHCEMKPYK